MNLGGNVKIQSTYVLAELELATIFARKSRDAFWKKQWKNLGPYIERAAGDLWTSGFVSTLPHLEGSYQERACAALIENELHRLIGWLEAGVEADSDLDILSRIRDGFQEITKAEQWIEAFTVRPEEQTNVWRIAVYTCRLRIWKRVYLEGAWESLRRLPLDEIGRKKHRSKASVGSVESSGYIQQMKIRAEKLSAMYKKMKKTRGLPYVWACKDIYQTQNGEKLWREFFTMAGSIFDNLSTGVNQLDTLAKKYSAGLKKLSERKQFKEIVPQAPPDTFNAEYSGSAFDFYIGVMDYAVWGLDAMLREEVTDIQLLMYFCPWEDILKIPLGEILTKLITELKGGYVRTSFVPASDLKYLHVHWNELLLKGTANQGEVKGIKFQLPRGGHR